MPRTITCAAVLLEISWSMKTIDAPITRRSFWMLLIALALAALASLALTSLTNATTADLTIEVGGDLAQHGGVVTVYPLPVPAESWPADAALGTVRVDQRHAEIQLRYPANGTFVYRFRSAGAADVSQRHPTQVLSIIGTDEKKQGPQMTAGFKDAYSSGGRIIRVPPKAEYAGEDETTRSNARWGITTGRYPPPPADERSARALVSIIEDDPQKPEFACSGTATVQVCVIPPDQWDRLTARWWRALAESRLDRMRDRAVRRCHDSSSSVGQCDPDPASNEPQYIKRH
jgi:hypothetical protein